MSTPPATQLARTAPPTALASMTTEELYAELTRQLELTADRLRQLAAVVRALEERGEDLSHLRLGLLAYLRQIAYGQVLPEVVVRFGGSPMLVKSVSALPLPDQRKLADGEPVKLAVRDASGGWTHRLVDPLSLGRSQINAVFGQGRIRDEAEQIVLGESRPARASRSGPIEHRSGITVDRRRNGLVVGRRFFPADEVLEALSLLRGEDPDVPRDTQVPVPLSHDEHGRLKALAHVGGVPMARLMRRGLLAAGLIGEERVGD